MKSKSIILALSVLILACSMTAIAAENVDVSGHTFEVPEGYAIDNSTDEQVIFTNDDGYAIVVLFSDEIANSDDAIKNLESKGYTFIAEETYNSSDYEVSQQNYKKDGLTVYSYNFELDDGKYCVCTLTIPSDHTAPEGDDNPITGIIKTIK